MYLLSIVINVVGWKWEIKREGKELGFHGMCSLATLSLMPGLNTVVALAFISQIFVKW